MTGPAKLPVPGPWQPAVQAALDHLGARLGLPRTSVAVTRLDEGASAEALDVWLMANGRTYRYVVGPSGATPVAAQPDR
ncbi:MAG: hypothetical protein ABI780_13440 [Ardenticatenales bacterium]